MTQLSTPALETAVEFVRRNGSDLTVALLDYHVLAAGDQGRIFAALTTYQNPDGGFAHGLEADLRLKHSSVIATTIALQILAELDDEQCEPLVNEAFRYLADTYDGTHWQLAGPKCGDAPHAPWWTFNPDWADGRDFLPNAAAEIAGYFLRWPAAAPPELGQELLRRAFKHLEGAELEMHDLLCYIRLIETPGLDPAQRAAMLAHLLKAANGAVKVQESEWEEYGLAPLDVVSRPDSALAGFFSTSLNANLDYRIRAQSDSGCWRPSWSWGGAYADTWDLVEVEISAALTEATLRKLKRFGRIDDQVSANSHVGLI